MHRRKARRLLSIPFSRRQSAAREVDEEIQSHLEQRVESLIEEGFPPEAAWAEAERRFGAVNGELTSTRGRLHAEAAARARSLNRRGWLESVRHDLRFTVRQVRRAPGHAAMVVMVLALGIGASTAVFTVLNAVLLKPLPYQEPDRLAVIWSLDSLATRTQASAPTWRDWQAESRTFEQIALHDLWQWPVVPSLATANALTATVAIVSQNFFEVLRPLMRYGRSFAAEEVAAGDRVLVVSEQFWNGALGRPARLPVALNVSGEQYEVIGVLPNGGEYPAEADLWIPGGYESTIAPRNAATMTAIGRLSDGRTLSEADQELDVVMARIRGREPDAMYAHGVVLEPLRENIIGNTDNSIRLISATGLLLLLIACTNAAAANLVRTTARTRDFAIRASLGASRGRILRQLVTEQLVLAMVSGLIGLWLAHAGTSWLAGVAGSELPRVRGLGFDARVLAVAGGCSLLSAAAAGLVPFGLLRGGALAMRAKSDRSASGHRLGRVLAGAQVAVALTLLSGAALLVESFRVLIARDLGFDTDRIATVNVNLISRYESSEQGLAYLNDLEQSVLAVPGVSAVGFSNAPPLIEGFSGGVQLEGSGARDLLAASYRVVSEHYFSAIGIPIVEGRGFDSQDIRGSPRVTLVNHTMAERYWPDESPLGKRLRDPVMDGQNAPWLTVVGVVGDARHWGYASDPQPEHYVLSNQVPGFAWGMTLVLRSRVSLDQVLPTVRARMLALDPGIPPELRSLDMQVGRTVNAWRLPMSIVSAFGFIALVLAALGVYTVFAFVVAQRTREIGVRMALGETSGAVLRGTVRDALKVTFVGAAIGSVAAYFLIGLARTMLVEGTPIDVRPLAVAWAVVIGTAAFAAYVPGRRASRVDPTVALRME